MRILSNGLGNKRKNALQTTERYTTVIELNSEQAKRNLDELRDAEKELKKYDNEVARTIETMNDFNSASVERIEEAQKSLRKLASEVPHDSSFYQQLNDQLDMVTQELENIKATKAFEQMQMEAAGATKKVR